MNSPALARTPRHPGAHTLMPLVIDPQRLRRCARAMMRNSGSPGADGVTWAQYRAGLNHRLSDLAARLADGTWTPGPLRRIVLPTWGKDIAMTIPTVEDRIVHRALREAAEPVLTADAYPDWMYGWRPQAGRLDALPVAAAHLAAGRTWVADLDVAGSTRGADLDALLDELARWVSDGTFLRLVRTVLEHLPTPLDSGSGLTPMLTNIRLLPVDEQLTGLPVIRVTDNYTVFCTDRAQAAAAAAQVTTAMAACDLQPNPSKSQLWQPNAEDLYLAG